MKQSKVVARSFSVNVADDDYPSKLLSNPTTVNTQSMLPIIYGPKINLKNLLKMSQYDQYVEQQITPHRQNDLKKSHIHNSPYNKSRDRYLGGSRVLKIESRVLNSSRSFHQSANRTMRYNKPKYRVVTKQTDSQAETQSKFIILQSDNSPTKPPPFQSRFNTEQSASLSNRKRFQTINSDRMTKLHSRFQTKVSQPRTTYFFGLSKLGKRLTSESIQTISCQQSFKIPSKQQIPEFIKNYKAFDCTFDLQTVTSSQAFKIVKGAHYLYLGEVVNQKPNGLGILCTQKRIYQGWFQQGCKVKGSQKGSTGLYVGNYRQGLRQGYGEYYWPNKDVYKGQWKQGKKHGIGRWEDKHGNYYEGEWVNNIQQGNGVFEYRGGYYKGEFKNFMKHGKGQQRLPNGDTYVGQYFEGKPHGHGVYTWKSGKVYEGRFEEGLRKQQKSIFRLQLLQSEIKLQKKQ